MYQPPIAVSATGAAGGATTLAVTGLDTAYYLVAAATLVFFGLALLRLIPRRES